MFDLNEDVKDFIIDSFDEYDDMIFDLLSNYESKIIKQIRKHGLPPTLNMEGTTDDKMDEYDKKTKNLERLKETERAIYNEIKKHLLSLITER